MDKLDAALHPIDALRGEEIAHMFALMERYYDGVDRTVFERDLFEKDSCVLLRDELGSIRGFSTQKRVTLDLDGETIHGVFSGDTIVDRAHWGSLALHRTFAQHFFAIGRAYPAFYWFLISKGYKTYKFLPTFFRAYYPRYDKSTPAREASIMRAFAHAANPEAYDEASGVFRYRTEKDRLKSGVADIVGARKNDPHIAFFERANPGYLRGDDLVCLADLREENLLPAARRLLQL